MKPQSTTFILNGNTYRLSPDDSGAIREMPKTDRLQLIELLEAIKIQEKLSEAAIQNATAKASPKAATAVNITSAGITAQQPLQQPKPERLGEADIENLMAKLIMEEKNKQKPPISSRQIYTWAGGILFVLILLTYLF